MEQYSRHRPCRGKPDADLQLILERTFKGIAEGGLVDEGSGGFFRYAQTPDWRNPQVEKLLEDNAALVRLFCRGFSLLGDESLKTAAKKGSLTTCARISGLRISGSLVARSLPMASTTPSRLKSAPSGTHPPLTRPFWTGANAVAVRALVAWWQITGETEALTQACRVMDFLLTNLVAEDGCPTHFQAAEGRGCRRDSHGDAC